MRPTYLALLTGILPWAGVAGLVACEPTVPEHPTWADVEPILRGNCTHCHGASARTDGRAGTEVYRFDFFEMSAASCGEAAKALDAPRMARGWAPLIEAAITAPAEGGRARMPPAPAPALSDWERETLVRWSQEPVLGTPSRENRRPQIKVVGDLECTVGDTLDFTVVVDDPDDEPVVGLLSLGPETIKLDGPGSFHVRVDTAGWETGRYPGVASLCDGWDQACYTLPEIVVIH